MDFKQACEIIQQTYVLTEREKSNFIRKAKQGDQVLLSILKKFKETQDAHEFYEDLQKNQLLSTSSLYNVRISI